MSCFGGRLTECSGILVADNFTDKRASGYLLSHFHADHVTGLELLADTADSASAAGSIWCSVLTAQLLLADQRYTSCRDRLKPLTSNTSHRVIGQCGQAWTLTLLPAGHCLGSVMFLVEWLDKNGCSQRILYTGDFRLPLVEATTQIESLLRVSANAHISAIYLDTTYLNPAAEFIPTREACVQAVVHAAREWLEQGPDRVVRLVGKARFSYEFLWKVLRRELGQTIHIAQTKLAEYGDKFGSQLLSDVTLDAQRTRLHACSYSASDLRAQDHLPCSYRTALDSCDSRIRVLTIQASSMYFDRVVGFGQLVVRISAQHLRVCFCFHPSQSELRHFLKLLQPRRAVACVPVAGESLSDTQRRLDQMLVDTRCAVLTNCVRDEVQSQDASVSASRRRRRRTSCTFSESLDNEDTDSFLFGLTDAKRGKSSHDTKT